MFANKFSAAGMLVIGFIVMGSVSVILNFKQARVVDAMGDAAKINAEIRSLNLDLDQLRQEEDIFLNLDLDQLRQEEDIDKKKISKTEEKISKIEEKIEKLQTEDLPEQRQGATNAMAALPNGAVFWSFLCQIGAGIFGLGLLSIFMREDEHPAVRSTALIVIGTMVLALLVARTAYLLVGGFSGVGSAL